MTDDGIKIVGLSLAVSGDWDNGDKLLCFFDCKLLGLRLNGCLLIRASRGGLLAQALRGDNERSLLLSALDYSKFDECDPASLSWQFKPDLATERAQAVAAEEFEHPISRTTINLSLACKIAVRRRLGIPVFFAHRSEAE